MFYPAKGGTAAEVNERHKVLEIGTGSGYQSAILLELGASVYTIERQRKLFLKAQQNLTDLGYKPHFFYGDGFQGKPSYGPFDRILVTAGAKDVPDSLSRQLKTGGIMVIPIGGSLSQEMIRIVRHGKDDFEKTGHGAFAFVPMLKGTKE